MHPSCAQETLFLRILRVRRSLNSVQIQQSQLFLVIPEIPSSWTWLWDFTLSLSIVEAMIFPRSFIIPQASKQKNFIELIEKIHEQLRAIVTKIVFSVVVVWLASDCFIALHCVFFQVLFVRWSVAIHGGCTPFGP